MSLSSLSLDLSFPRFLQRVVPSSISLQQSKKIEERRENRRSITFRILCSRNYSLADKTNMLKVQYKTDCEKFYGRILDNRNVVSVVEGTSKQKTAEIWSSLYPEEPYELAFNITFLEGAAEKFSECVENIKYDLVSAVRGQIVFFYQVSRPSMHDDCFHERAVAGYKGLKFISGGLIGLLRGIEKFDSSKGHKISTYVYWWIRQVKGIAYRV